MFRVLDPGNNSSNNLVEFFHKNILNIMIIK